MKVKEIAFIKNYRADSEEEGHEDEVETLQYYCESHYNMLKIFVLTKKKSNKQEYYTTHCCSL